MEIRKKSTTYYQATGTAIPDINKIKTDLMKRLDGSLTMANEYWPTKDCL